MSANMIAAVIIAIISCVVVILAVVFLSSGVLQKLKKEVFRYIKVYNKYMEEASVKESVAEENVSSLNEEDTFGIPKDPAIPFIAKNASMQKKDFFADYVKLRNAFDKDATQALQNIPEFSKEEIAMGMCVDSMLEKLSFESVYQISCLQQEKQLLVLNEIFSQTEQEILKMYTEERGACSVTEFYTYLQGKSKELDRMVYVYSGQPERLGIQEESEQLKICRDENLCEGFQIIIGNRLYDYGVRSSEMTL